MTNQIVINKLEHYMNSDSTAIGTISNCSTSTVTMGDTLKNQIDELTKKPEVREDQRSALNVSKDAVYAYYYT